MEHAGRSVILHGREHSFRDSQKVYEGTRGELDRYINFFLLLQCPLSPPHTPFFPSPFPRTCDEVCSVLTQVDNWIEFGKCLDIPVSDLKTINRTQPNPHAVKEMVQKWLQNHPAPSWSLVREALYQRGYYEPNLHQISKNAYIN